MLGNDDGIIGSQNSSPAWTPCNEVSEICVVGSAYGKSKSKSNTIVGNSKSCVESVSNSNGNGNSKAIGGKSNDNDNNDDNDDDNVSFVAGNPPPFSKAGGQVPVAVGDSMVASQIKDRVRGDTGEIQRPTGVISLWATDASPGSPHVRALVHSPDVLNGMPAPAGNSRATGSCRSWQKGV